MPSSEVVKARNKVAQLCHPKSKTGTPEAIEDARRELAATKLRVYVAEVLATAPKLTDAQTEAVIGLLRRGGVQ